MSLASGRQMREFEALREECISSVLQVRQKALRKSPRSTEDWLMMMLSSWLQPEKQAMATMGLAPMGIWLTEMYRVGRVVTRGRCGQYSWWFSVSIRVCVFIPLIPIACFDIALCSVFLVAWLWFGKGISDPHTPNSIEGWISQWVYRILRFRRQVGSRAISSVSSSSTSTYSTTPPSCNYFMPASSYKCCGVNIRRFSSTTSSGLMHLPASVLMRISFPLMSATTDMESLSSPFLRHSLKAPTKRGKDFEKATRLPSTSTLMSWNCSTRVAKLLQGVVTPKMKLLRLSLSRSYSSSLTFTSMAKFFTIPIFWPSGVSDGQIMPKCVLWRRRGLADLELERMGATTLRRWERVAKQLVSRLRTWATPVRIGSPAMFLPQLPVDRACFSPLLMQRWSKMSSILSYVPSRPLCSSRFSNLLAFSRYWLRKRSMKRFSMSAPVRSMRFLPQWSRSSSPVIPRKAAISRRAMYPTQYAFFRSSMSFVPMCGNSFSIRFCLAQCWAVSSSMLEFRTCSRHLPRKTRHSCCEVKATCSPEFRRISVTPLNSAFFSSEVFSLRRSTSQMQMRIYSSDPIPRARKRMPRGISLRMFLILHKRRGCPFSILMLMRKICGREPMLLPTDRISASQGSLSVFCLKTKTWLKAIRSCPTTTFSDPFTMKYPPWSYGHSPFSTRSCSLSFERQHQSEPTMMGTSATSTLGKHLYLRRSRSLRALILYLLQWSLALMTPWQVRSRSRQTAGVSSDCVSSPRLTSRWSRVQESKQNSHSSSPLTSSPTANWGGMLSVKWPWCWTTNCMSLRKRLQELTWMLAGAFSLKILSTTDHR